MPLAGETAGDFRLSKMAAESDWGSRESQALSILIFPCRWMTSKFRARAFHWNASGFGCGSPSLIQKPSS